MAAPVSELTQAISDFIGELKLRSDSPHTIRNYAADLREFADYFSPPGENPPPVADFEFAKESALHPPQGIVTDDAVTMEELAGVQSCADTPYTHTCPV